MTLATFGVSVGMLVAFHAGHAGYQLVEQASWVGVLGFRYVLGVDGISVFMVVLTAFLMPLAVLASWHVERSAKTYFFAFLFLETATIGAFVALDLLLFFVFFEGLLFPMYLIIGGWGGRRRAYAAMKFFIYTMAGSAFLLLGILFLAFGADAVLGHQTLDVRQLAALPLPVTTARWLFLAFLRRLRRQGAAGAGPHVAARRVRRGADGRHAGAVGAAGQGRRVRPDPLQPVAVPRGVRVLPGPGAGAGGDRDPLRGGGRARPDATPSG